MVVTAHFISNSDLQSIILDFDLIPYPHKSENLLDIIQDIFDLYSLKKKIISITTDNEKANVKCLQLLLLFNENYEDVVPHKMFSTCFKLSCQKGITRNRRSLIIGVQISEPD